MEKNKHVIISEGNRPWWQLVFAALHYVAICYLLFFFFVNFEFTSNHTALNNSFVFLQVATLLLPSALAFSVVKDIIFDLEAKKYKIDFCVGPIRIGKWVTLLDIEYVSVFKQPKQESEFVYKANLWYNRNKHFNIYESSALEPAYEMGKNVAKILEVKLLDATVPNNFKWVPLDDYEVVK